MKIIKVSKYRHKMWFKIAIIGVLCLFYFNTMSWAMSPVYKPPRATLAAQSIFRPILNVVGRQHLSRSLVEMTLIVNMALKGLKGEAEEEALKFRSRLDINASLDKQYSQVEEEKLLEVVDNPRLREDGAIEIRIRTTSQTGEQRGFRIIFRGDTIDDMLDTGKIEVMAVTDKDERERAGKEFDLTKIVPESVGNPEEYGKYLESVFDEDDIISDFIKQQAGILKKMHCSYINAKTKDELYSYLGLSAAAEYPETSREKEIMKTVEEHFPVSESEEYKVLASKSVEGGNEYIWLCFRDRKRFSDDVTGFKEYFYVNRENVAHGYSAVHDDRMCDLAMGVDREDIRHKGHMQVLFNMKQSVLMDEFDPLFLRVPHSQVLSSPQARLFYLRRGYLPINPDARKKVIDEFLGPWLESGRTYRVEHPVLLFDLDFLYSCGDFVLATRDPRVETEEVKPAATLAEKAGPDTLKDDSGKVFDYNQIVPDGVGEAGQYGEFIESVFDRDDIVTDFLKEQARSSERSHYSYIKADTPSELYSYLELSRDSDYPDSSFGGQIKKAAEEYFTGPWAVKRGFYVSKSIVGENEYVWLSFLNWKAPDGEVASYKEYFYVNGEKIAHGYSTVRGNKMCDMAMGIDKEDMKHKGHMQVLFNIKQSVLKDEFDPIFFRAYKGQVLTSFDALFFYLRRGYLPLDPDARKTVIDRFLKPWLESGRKLRVEDPHLLFDDNFFKSCGEFVLATRDPRLKIEDIKPAAGSLEESDPPTLEDNPGKDFDYSKVLPEWIQDPEEYGRFLEFVFEEEGDVNDFLKGQARRLEKSHCSYIKARTPIELYSYLGFSPDTMPQGSDLAEEINSYFSGSSGGTPTVYAAKSYENGNEYVYLSFLVWESPYDEAKGFEERFFVNKERIAHGFTNTHGDMLSQIFMGVDREDLRHKGHMQALFDMKQHVLKDEFNPALFRVHKSQVLTSWESIFFYLRRGYLPLNPVARRIIIERFVKPWLESDGEFRPSPYQVFTSEFLENCDFFVLATRDPRLPIPRAEKIKLETGPAEEREPTVVVPESRIHPQMLEAVLHGADAEMYEGLRELAFRGDSDVSRFLRQQAEKVKGSRYSCVEATTQSEVYSYLGLEETAGDEDIASMKRNIESKFLFFDSPRLYMSKANVEGNEYIWLSFFAGTGLLGSTQFAEEFYVNNKKIADGFCDGRRDFVVLQTGVDVDKESMRHKGHMQVLFDMRQSILDDKFSPFGFMVPGRVMSIWDALFFYVRKGYLPVNSLAREKIIDKFLTPWLKDRDYMVEDPEKEFGSNFLYECGGFILFLRDPGYSILGPERRMPDTGPVKTGPAVEKAGAGAEIDVPVGIDEEKYREFVEFVFEGDNETSSFLRQEADLLARTHYSYVEAETEDELCSYLGTAAGLDRERSPLGRGIKEYFEYAKKPHKVYASKSYQEKEEGEGIDEYVWVAFLEGSEFYEYFYVNGEGIAHGYSNCDGDFIRLRMGRDIRHLKHKGHMQALFRMKQSVLRDVMNPVLYRVHRFQIPDWNSFFFYVRKGYLPVNPDARKTVIDKFLDPWLKDRNYWVSNPDEVFGCPSNVFLSGCHDFVLFTRDPRIPVDKIRSSRKPEEVSPPPAAEEKVLDEFTLSNDLMLLNRASRHLKDYPVDMIIDLSLIPREDLEANMRTWVYLIMLHNKYGLDVNYIFVDKEDEQYEIDSMRMLIRQVRDIAAQFGMDEDEILNRVNKPHPDPRTLKVHIMKLKDLERLQLLHENMLPVAMSEGQTRAGVPLRDFSAAATIGLAQAACKKAQRADAQNPDEEPALPGVIKEILPKIREVYKRLLPDEIITEQTVANMINGNFAVRKNLAMALALPPIVRMAVEQIEIYHDRIHLLLQAA